MQLINNEWFDRLGWDPKYVNGSNPTVPGDLLARDESTNVVWQYQPVDDPDRPNLAETYVPIGVAQPVVNVSAEDWLEWPVSTNASLFDPQALLLNLTREVVLLLNAEGRNVAPFFNTEEGAAADFFAEDGGNLKSFLDNGGDEHFLNNTLDENEFWSTSINTRIIGAGCMSELVMQLATLMLVNIFVGQAKEIALPLIMVQVQKLLALFNIRKSEDDVNDEALMQPWEKQAKLVPFAGTFDEYAEMVIQL